MFINNELRDKVYKNNLAHGFWDNIRPYVEFTYNLFGEFRETMNELMSGRSPTEVYYKSGNKPEGAPTELADIIIFILDYFGGSDPQIDVDEVFLDTPDEYYKNPEWYKKTRGKDPWQYFIEIEDLCREHISLSILHYALHENDTYVDENGKERSVSLELHAVIKLILEFCEIYGIDMEKELIAKIDYNNSRPKDYRKMGNEKLLETNPNKVFREMLQLGHEMYNETDNVVKRRERANKQVLGKREARRQLESEDGR